MASCPTTPSIRRSRPGIPGTNWPDSAAGLNHWIFPFQGLFILAFLYVLNYNLFYFYFFIRFKIDINYVGEPPAVEITITNLNDNIDVHFLKDLIRKCGEHDEPIIYYHPLTHKHLGLARIVFESVKSANACIEKYNGTSVMGKVRRSISKRLL